MHLAFFFLLEPHRAELTNCSWLSKVKSLAYLHWRVYKKKSVLEMQAIKCLRAVLESKQAGKEGNLHLK